MHLLQLVPGLLRHMYSLRGSVPTCLLASVLAHTMTNGTMLSAPTMLGRSLPSHTFAT